MDWSIKPIVVSYGYRLSNGAIRFVGHEEDVKVLAYARELQSILKHCNGLNTLAQIRYEAKSIPENLFEALVEFSLKKRIILDHRKLFLDFHLQTSRVGSVHRRILSPARPFGKARTVERETSTKILSTWHSPLLRLIKKRRSHRSFSNKPVPIKKIAGLLESIYGMNGFHSVPSAGGLYPLRLFLTLRKPTGKLPLGTYAYDPVNHVLLPQSGSIDDETLAVLTEADFFLGSGACLIWAVATFQIAAKKYLNRSYRYIFNETGHAFQNGYLYCTEQGLGAVELGGFRDEDTAKFLGLRFPEEAVVSALLVGYPQPESISRGQESTPSLAQRLTLEYVGPSKPIEEIGVGEYGWKGDPPTRYTAFARLASQNSSFAGGVGLTSSEAALKAIGEGFERHASGLLRIDKSCPAEELNSAWIDPNIAAPFAQIGGFNVDLQTFDPKKNWDWVSGTRGDTNENIFVPIDLVFYPLSEKKLGRKPCAFASSSGAAAHTSKSEAKVSALLELIERDALMATWYSRKKVTAVPLEFIDPVVRTRIKKIEQQGFSVRILDFSMDSCPVAVTVIWSRKSYPHFVAGASAALHWGRAINKGFTEAEDLWFSFITSKRRRSMNKEDVRSPEDHGRLYAASDHLDQVAWLIRAREKAPSVLHCSAADLFSRFEPAFVDLSSQEDSSLHVVRAVSEKLLPINFGYGTEHVGHSRIKRLGLSWKRVFPSFPHFFA